MTIYFVGWYGKRNSGDEAFKLVHKKLFPDMDVRWISDEPVPNQEPGDVIVLGGGDVARSFYTQHIPKNSRFYVYGVGIDGDDDFECLVSCADRIIEAWIRHEPDVDRLRECGVNAHYTPDIVFQLRDQVPAIEPDIVDGRKRMVCFFSNNLVQHSLFSNNLDGIVCSLQLKRQIADALDGISHAYRFDFIPMSFDFNDFDLSFCCDIFSMMNERESINIVEQELSFAQVLRYVRSANVVFSMKLHGLVYSCLSGVPFINIGHSRKTHIFCEELGMTEVSMPKFHFEYNRFLNALAYAEQAKTRTRVDEIGKDLFEKASAIGAEFVGKVASR